MQSLHKACVVGNLSLVQEYIDSKSDLNKLDNISPWLEDQPPLAIACLWGWDKIVQLLVTSGADVNRVDADGRTPLFWVGCAKIVRILLAAGADANIPDRYGCSPLSTACQKKFDIIVNILARVVSDNELLHCWGKTHNSVLKNEMSWRRQTRQLAILVVARILDSTSLLARLPWELVRHEVGAALLKKHQ